ncbi:MAG: DUF1838 family protein [Rhodospirillaceae bacterium]|jgi:hypothetical protein|nr:DUF1838 family protein [Rhodospirillaceae bacterium]MBT5240268.1 DUF1838 family protein [Rhodospirillaceae bacterium]MBT5565427.1 DUF1838 family protein [Rhodospirillaceae bacterium]MBT6089257.1 DUF1838 family protein [Rhodospirillaceae bacterium]
MSNPKNGNSRRTALALGAGGMAALTSGAPRSASAAMPNLDNPADFLTTVVKMRGATDGSIAMGWVMGQRYAVFDGRITPMFGLLASTFFKYTRIDELTFEMRSFEVAYFTDLATGKLLEKWENPFTGEVCDVPQTRMGPSIVPVKPGGFDLTSVPSMGAMDASHFFRPAVTQGDDIWITEEIKIAGDPPNSGPSKFRYNEMTTYNAKLSDLAKPDLATVPTSIQYQSIVGFSPWQKMAGVEAMNMGRGSGKRATRIEDMPPYYIELTEKYHPDVLNDPEAVLYGPREG